MPDRLFEYISLGINFFVGGFMALTQWRLKELEKRVSELAHLLISHLQAC